jgi:hypothetical protein
MHKMLTDLVTVVSKVFSQLVQFPLQLAGTVVSGCEAIGHNGSKSDTQQQAQDANDPQGTCSVQRYHYCSSLLCMHRTAPVNWSNIVLDSVVM